MARKVVEATEGAEVAVTNPASKLVQYKALNNAQLRLTDDGLISDEASVRIRTLRTDDVIEIQAGQESKLPKNYFQKV